MSLVTLYGGILNALQRFASPAAAPILLNLSMMATLALAGFFPGPGYAAAWGSVDAPAGGVGDSGLGRRHGAEGILKYTDVQTIATQRLLPIAPLPGMSQETWAKTLTVASGSRMRGRVEFGWGDERDQLPTTTKSSLTLGARHAS